MLRRTKVVGVCALCFTFVLAPHASAQDKQEQAAPTADKPADLPPLVVETTTAKKKKPAKPAQKKAAAPAAPTPAIEAAQSSGEGKESATGPVNGYVAKQTATGTKTDTPIVEVPQAISVVPADQMRDQGAQSTSQALRYTPGVLVERDGATARVDVARVRGFEALFYLDGMALPQFADDFAQSLNDPYNLERIEVLKGPPSVLYGRNSPGGIVNLVSKRPTETAQNEVFLEFGSFQNITTGFDFSGPVTTDKTFLYRVVGSIQDAETQIDYTNDDRGFIAPSFTWQPNKDTSLTVLGHYGKDKGTVPLQYVPSDGSLNPNPNGRIPRSRFLGEPGFDSFEREQFWAGYIFSHRFNDVWQIRHSLRYTDISADTQAYQFIALDADMRTGFRAGIAPQSDTSALTSDTQVQADFSTGALAHKMIFGFDYAKSKLDYKLDTNFLNLGPPIDVFDPIYTGVRPAIGPWFQSNQELSQYGFYAQDQIKVDGLIVTLGIRHDIADSYSSAQNVVFDPVPSIAEPTDYATTYRAGVGYELAPGLIPYASYSTSFDPTLGTDRLGNAFEPTTGEQYEIGVKYQPPGTQTLLTLAAFDITRQNITTTDPIDSNFQIQIGEVKARGFEAEARSELTRNLQLIAGYSFLDTEVTGTTEPGQLGSQLPGTPKHTASAWLYYTFDDTVLRGFGFGGGVRYTGTKDETFGTLEQPSYTLFDLGAHYDLENIDRAFEGARLSLSIHNVTDEYYVTNCFPGSCLLGGERSFLSTLSYKW